MFLNKQSSLTSCITHVSNNSNHTSKMALVEMGKSYRNVRDFLFSESALLLVSTKNCDLWGVVADFYHLHGKTSWSTVVVNGTSQIPNGNFHGCARSISKTFSSKIDSKAIQANRPKAREKN